MSCSRTFRSILFFATLFSFFPSLVFASDREVAIRTFLSELSVPPDIRTAFSAVSPDSTGPWLAERPDGIYCLAVAATPRNDDPEVRAALEEATAQRTAMRASGAVVLHVLRGKLDRKTFRDDDALGNAVIRYYGDKGLRGLASRSTVSDGYALSLVRLPLPEAAPLIAAPPKVEQLGTDYCTILYDRARRYMDAANYAEALSVFKHIHDFRFANVGAYLDASECFLRTGGKTDAAKLLSELIATVGDGMTSDELARAGRLFREAGLTEQARSAFVDARKRLREGK